MLYPKLCYNEPCYEEVNVYLANSADPDQTPHNAASDQAVHSLH